ncbi:MAG TPA: FCD domain-containing protein [Oryzihumus sp.]|nr:FCD domain-containing protein [Oryzihumus sp.]
MSAVPTDVGRLPDAVLRPAPGNAFESTVEQLATAIRLGVFAHGELLPPERELAERLGVSRMTLRDAIAALRDSGMVQTTRGRGGGTTVVYAGSPPGEEGSPSVRHGADLADALAFRRVVEPGAAFLAAGRSLSADQRAWLTSAAREVRAAPDAAAHRMADSRLHLALAALSGSPMLIEAVTRAQSALHELLSAIPVLPRNIAHSNDQHDAVVAAVLGGDAEGARRLMEEHCDATSALLRGLLG